MNILLITPDAVGGTLLSRMLSVYLQINPQDKPTIDAGHLELGVKVYKNEHLGIDRCLGIDDDSPHHNQPLNEVQDMLEQCDQHYTIAKLPWYNLALRQDTAEQTQEFYKYINDNFFIISCRRENLFEHSVSWALNKVTGRLNEFKFSEKINNWAYLQQNKITLDPLTVTQSLNDYKKFINWCDTEFELGSIYTYEKDMPNIDNYILSLPMFDQNNAKTWQDKFGQTFEEFNQHQYHATNINKILNQHIVTEPPDTAHNYRMYKASIAVDCAVADFVNKYNSVKDPSWPDVASPEDWEEVPDIIKNECIQDFEINFYLDNITICKNRLNKSLQQYKIIVDSTESEKIRKLCWNASKTFLDSTADKYNSTITQISEYVDNGVMSSLVPIKKHTLEDKLQLVENLSECIDTYNMWIEQNPNLGSPIDKNKIASRLDQEQSYWQTGLTTP